MSIENGSLTDQELFWKGDFGDHYVGRNQGEALVASNVGFFAEVLKHTGQISSFLEFGANIGLNMRALRQLAPNARLSGVEINQAAAAQLSEAIGSENTTNASLFDFQSDVHHELTFTKGVLIHLHPEKLPIAYDKLYN